MADTIEVGLAPALNFAVSPISNEEAANLGVPELLLSRSAGDDVLSRKLESEFIFFIHVPISSEVVATFGAQDVGVRLLGFGKINKDLAVGAF